MGYTFISYSSKNQQMADSFRTLFNKNGIKTWMAPGDIPFGSTYTSTINRAIKDSSCFVLLFSESAQGSPWVLKETERAVSTGKTIFTVLLDDVSMNDDFEFMLSTSQAIAVRRIDESDDKIKRLILAIKSYIGENKELEIELDINDTEITPQRDLYNQLRKDQHSVKTYLKAAIEGDPNAMYALGQFFEDEKYSQSSIEKAIKWYDAAVKKGHPNAQYARDRCIQLKNSKEEIVNNKENKVKTKKESKEGEISKNKHVKRWKKLLIILIIILCLLFLLLIISTTHIKSDNTDAETITDSWEQLIEYVNDGTYKEKYKIGDTKDLDLGPEGIVQMQIVAFDTDELADGSGKAAITWISKQLIYSDQSMNPEQEVDPSDPSKYLIGTGSIGGWENSWMRSWLQSYLKSMIPAVVNNAIKPVTKYSTSYTTDGNEYLYNAKSVDDIWIPSWRELFGSDSSYSDFYIIYESEGPIYYYFKSDHERVKLKSGNTIISLFGPWWWLRSAEYKNENNGNEGFKMVDTDGMQGFDTSEFSHAITFGFCI